MEAYRYNAFISYRHVEPDMTIAKKLQSLLEHYHPPGAVAARTGISRVRLFRDEDELPTGSDLSAGIAKALEQSEYLICICSPAYLESRWCMQEIDAFKAMHDGSNEKIIVLVADGTPPEIFPEQLLHETRHLSLPDGTVETQEVATEPLAANVAAPGKGAGIKKLKEEFLRIASPLFHCGYAELVGREQKRRTRRVLTVSLVALAGMAAIVTYTTAMFLRIRRESRATRIASAGILEREATAALQADEPLRAVESVLEAVRIYDSLGEAIPARLENVLSEAAMIYDTDLGNPYLHRGFDTGSVVSDICMTERAVAVCDDRGGLYIFEKERGRLLQEFRLSSPVLDLQPFMRTEDGTLQDRILILTADELACFDLNVMRTLWRTHTGGGLSHTFLEMVHDLGAEVVAVRAASDEVPYGQFHFIDKSTGQEIYETAITISAGPQPVYRSAMSGDGLVAVALHSNPARTEVESFALCLLSAEGRYEETWISLEDGEVLDVTFDDAGDLYLTTIGRTGPWASGGIAETLVPETEEAETPAAGTEEAETPDAGTEETETPAASAEEAEAPDAGTEETELPAWAIDEETPIPDNDAAQEKILCVEKRATDRPRETVWQSTIPLALTGSPFCETVAYAETLAGSGESTDVLLAVIDDHVLGFSRGEGELLTQYRLRGGVRGICSAGPTGATVYTADGLYHTPATEEWRSDLAALYPDMRIRTFSGDVAHAQMTDTGTYVTAGPDATRVDLYFQVQTRNFVIMDRGVCHLCGIVSDGAGRVAAVIRTREGTCIVRTYPAEITDFQNTRFTDRVTEFSLEQEPVSFTFTPDGNLLFTFATGGMEDEVVQDATCALYSIHGELLDSMTVEGGHMMLSLSELQLGYDRYPVSVAGGTLLPEGSFFSSQNGALNHVHIPIQVNDFDMNAQGQWAAVITPPLIEYYAAGQGSYSVIFDDRLPGDGQIPRMLQTQHQIELGTSDMRRNLAPDIKISESGEIVAYINGIRNQIEIVRRSEQNARSEIAFRSGEFEPVELMILPDDRYLLALSGTGVLVKYDLETLQPVGETDLSDLCPEDHLASDLQLFYLTDENEAVVRLMRTGVVVDLLEMEVRARIDGFVGCVEGSRIVYAHRDADSPRGYLCAGTVFETERALQIARRFFGKYGY